MVGHQDASMDRAPIPLCALTQPTQVQAVVVVIEEDGLPVVPALHDMRRDARQEEPAFACHRSVLARYPLDSFAELNEVSDFFFVISPMTPCLPTVS
jgi:hypothetical protein